MRKVLNLLYRLVITALALMPVGLLVGFFISGSWENPLKWMLASAALAFLATLLPGSVGWGKRTFPLRAVAGGMIAVLMIAAPLVIPWLAMPDRSAWLRCLYAFIYAILFLLMLRECAARAPFFGRINGLAVGLGAYLVAGIAVWAFDLSEINNVLYGCGAAYLVLSAFSLNGESLDLGYASHKERKPPARILRANRWMLVLLIAIVAFIALFDRIREWASDMALRAVQAIARFIGWLLSLLPVSETEMGAMEGGEPAGFFPMEETEPNLFWEILYYIALALACVALLFLLYKGARILAKKLKVLFKRISDYFKRFARAVSEDYVDERESLFDSKELRRTMRERLQRGLGRFTRREKKWEQMNATEKVRCIVRTLYRRAGNSLPRLSSMTVREAARELNTAEADPEALADLYERARYGDELVNDDEADAMRKAAKL